MESSVGELCAPWANHPRILRHDPLSSPLKIAAELPASEAALAFVDESRETIRRALAGEDRRLLLILGPCSIHDPKSALEYADRLSHLQSRVESQFILVMRVYFEKPRTTVGWKGYVTDPKMDSSDDMELGLRKARELLLQITKMKIPCATEFLDPVVPPYLADLVSWCAIGARTTESQTHRQMASGLSMPVGFKNATDGSLRSATNAMLSAAQPHSFLGIAPTGVTAILRTAGNPDAHLVLRGSEEHPNYEARYIDEACLAAGPKGPKRMVLVDCSHGNSQKDFRRQGRVFDYVVSQFAAGRERILGMMLESHLGEGNQALKSAQPAKYGVSVTDSCLGWEDTERLVLNGFEVLESARRSDTRFHSEVAP